jgi:hypothetical protein
MRATQSLRATFVARKARACLKRISNQISIDEVNIFWEEAFSTEFDLPIRKAEDRRADRARMPSKSMFPCLSRRRRREIDDQMKGLQL